MTPLLHSCHTAIGLTMEVFYCDIFIGTKACPYCTGGLGRYMGPEDRPSNMWCDHRRLARKYHPDKNPAGRERFVAVQKAYERLQAGAAAGQGPQSWRLLLILKVSGPCADAVARAPLHDLPAGRQPTVPDVALQRMQCFGMYSLTEGLAWHYVISSLYP